MAGATAPPRVFLICTGRRQHRPHTLAVLTLGPDGHAIEAEHMKGGAIRRRLSRSMAAEQTPYGRLPAFDLFCSLCNRNPQATQHRMDQLVAAVIGQAPGRHRYEFDVSAVRW